MQTQLRVSVSTFGFGSQFHSKVTVTESTRARRRPDVFIQRSSTAHRFGPPDTPFVPLDSSAKRRQPLASPALQLKGTGRQQSSRQTCKTDIGGPLQKMDSGHITAKAMKETEARRRWWEFDQGVYVAAAILTGWGLMVHYTVFHVTLPSWQALLLFLPMMQLHTGVFITAHEAMHGSVAPSNPALNDFFGRLACTLYAGEFFACIWVVTSGQLDIKPLCSF